MDLLYFKIKLKISSIFGKSSKPFVFSILYILLLVRGMKSFSITHGAVMVLL